MIGHKHIWDRLKNDLELGRLAHAHLFVGPAHTGKTHLAKTFSVIAQGGDSDVLLKKSILEGTEADTVMFLDNGEPLTIEEVRTISARAGQSHTRPYLIFVVEDLGRMKPEAANSLLKTLEEPSEGTVFFLTANNEDSVLATIRSRCTVTRFQSVPDAEMRAACGEHVYADELVFFSMGAPGKLMRLMEDSDYFAAHREILADVTVFLDRPSVPAAFQLVRKYEGSPVRDEMLDVLLRRVRASGAAGAGGGALGLDKIAFLEQIEEAKRRIDANVNARLTLENLLLSFVP
jgi:DNA polymerase-3 subunit delta'